MSERKEQGKRLEELVLDQIQGAFPLEADPYGILAKRLGAKRPAVLAAVKALRADGTIRRMGASFSSAKLGYRSTLCALAVSGDEAAVDRVAALVSAHAQVTHNYLRSDRFNIWFTMIAESDEVLVRVFDQIVAETGVPAEDALNLPATALYKIRVDFGGAGVVVCAPSQDAPFDAADPFDVALARWAQGDAEGEYPFADAARAVAAETGDASVDEERVIRRLLSWQADGTLRRFGAMVQHRQMGYSFNGMTVWDADPSRIDEVGRMLASFAHVSHCYARPRTQAWPHNLYAMTHAKTREQLDVQVSELAQATGLEPKVLISTKEYKKTSPVYFAKE